jgi:hypothetical protein
MTPPVSFSIRSMRAPTRGTPRPCPRVRLRAGVPWLLMLLQGIALIVSSLAGMAMASYGP